MGNRFSAPVIITFQLGDEEEAEASGNPAGKGKAKRKHKHHKKKFKRKKSTSRPPRRNGSNASVGTETATGVILAIGTVMTAAIGIKRSLRSRYGTGAS